MSLKHTLFRATCAPSTKLASPSWIFFSIVGTPNHRSLELETQKSFWLLLFLHPACLTRLSPGNTLTPRTYGIWNLCSIPSALMQKGRRGEREEGIKKEWREGRKEEGKEKRRWEGGKKEGETQDEDRKGEERKIWSAF